MLHRDDMARIFSRVAVDRSTGCWTWTGSTAGGGYGSMRLAGKTWRAHRVVYEGFIEAVPDGLELDHLFGVGRAAIRLILKPSPIERIPCEASVWQPLTRPRRNALTAIRCHRGAGTVSAGNAGAETCELAHKRRLNAAKRSRQGMCRDCSTAESTPGYRTCPTCREKNLVRELLRRSLSSALDKVLRSKPVQADP